MEGLTKGSSTTTDPAPGAREASGREGSGEELAVDSVGRRVVPKPVT